MSIARVALHAFEPSGSGHRGRPQLPCNLDQSLWDDAQMHAGAMSGVLATGLLAQPAMEVVLGIRKSIPSYCFCDLACFLCLGKF